MVAGAALSLIVDVRCMTARRWNLVLARITIVGFARFPLLLLFQDVSPDHRAFWLFAAATGPVALSGLIGAWFVPRASGGRHRLGPKPDRTRAMVRYSAVNYVSTLAYQAPYFLLPVIVLANVSNDTYASFNVAWGIVAVAFYVPTAIGQALLAEGGRDGAHVHHQLRLAMCLALGLMLAGTLVTFVGSDLITSIYGAAYSEAADILPAMVAAGIPWAVTSLYLSEVRILHRHVATVAITGALTIGIVAPALVLVPDDGPRRRQDRLAPRQHRRRPRGDHRRARHPGPQRRGPRAHRARDRRGRRRGRHHARTHVISTCSAGPASPIRLSPGRCSAWRTAQRRDPLTRCRPWAASCRCGVAASGRRRRQS